MIDEHDVREMLLRRANAVRTSRVDAPKAVRRARRRLLANGAVAVLAAVAIALATFAGVQAVRTAPIPADEDRSEDLGIFAPVSGRILFENGWWDDSYAPGFWAVDPNGPVDRVPGPRVDGDVASALVPLELDGEPLGWSSDGTELLLLRSVGDGLFPEQYLSILHADGSETRSNRDPMGISDATISPDGTRVVFSGQYDLSGLYAIDAEGGQPIPLPIPQAGEDVGSPRFSPDGTQIAYLAGNGEAQVWVANADGTDAHQILADEPTVLRGLTGFEWSPAGDHLAIGVGTHRRSGGSIYTFAPDGSDFTKVIVGGSSPYWSPDGSQIAYTIQCDEDPTFTCVQFDPQAGSSPAGLAIADADGSNVRAFGFAASGPWHPGVSATDEPVPTPVETPTPDESDDPAPADGEVLTFTGTSDTPGDLAAVDPATGEERVLVEDLDIVYSARWSADGRWVAYEAPGQEGVGLWILGVSQEPRQVATGASMLAWSSTGAELATIRLAEPFGADIAGSTLSTIDPVTGETTDMGSIPDSVGDITSAPAWSPDGTRFVFGARGGAIYSIDVRSGARSLLVQLPGGHLDSVDQILWSPDGAHIAVMNDLAPGGGRLYVMDADGTNIDVLVDDYDPMGVAWSPDGIRLAYADGQDRIWVVAMDGSAPIEIGPPLPASSAGDVLFSLGDLTWSSDGSQVAFRHTAFLTTGGVSVDLSALDADGSAEATRIDELTYRSWDGGSYSCGCV